MIKGTPFGVPFFKQRVFFFIGKYIWKFIPDVYIQNQQTENKLKNFFKKAKKGLEIHV